MKIVFTLAATFIALASVMCADSTGNHEEYICDFVFQTGPMILAQLSDDKNVENRADIIRQLDENIARIDGLLKQGLVDSAYIVNFISLKAKAENVKRGGDDNKIRSWEEAAAIMGSLNDFVYAGRSHSNQHFSSSSSASWQSLSSSSAAHDEDAELQEAILLSLSLQDNEH